jgi:hypothetical protein
MEELHYCSIFVSGGDVSITLSTMGVGVVVLSADYVSCILESISSRCHDRSRVVACLVVLWYCSLSFCMCVFDIAQLLLTLFVCFDFACCAVGAHCISYSFVCPVVMCVHRAFFFVYGSLFWAVRCICVLLPAVCCRLATFQCQGMQKDEYKQAAV